MPSIQDGPDSPLFTPLPLTGNTTWSQLAEYGISGEMAAADAVTILEQIEGALAYLDSVGTRAADQAYKRMRLVLTSAYRRLHNRLHELGYYHEHSAVSEH